MSKPPRKRPSRSKSAIAAREEESFEAQRSYWEALGQFVSRFAEIERAMQILLRSIAGVHDHVGKAVFSGVRADAAKDLINRTLDAKGDETTKAALKRHFEQFGIITKIRNDILHYGAQFDSLNRATISNAIVTHIPDRLRKFQITPDDLEDMTIDLNVIKIGIYVALGLEYGSKEWLAHWYPLSQSPWLYKQPPPASQSGRPPKTPPKPPRPPKS